MGENQMGADIAHDAYRVAWSAEDGEFVATCVEFPSLSWLAPTRAEALRGLHLLVEDVIEDLVAERESGPATAS